MLSRQARVKPQYAAWYPRLMPGTWQDAARAAQEVERQLASGEPRWVPEGRLLDEAHFDFFGGARVRYRGTERRATPVVVPSLP